MTFCHLFQMHSRLRVKLFALYSFGSLQSCLFLDGNLPRLIMVPPLVGLKLTPKVAIQPVCSLGTCYAKCLGRHKVDVGIELLLLFSNIQTSFSWHHQSKTSLVVYATMVYYFLSRNNYQLATKFNSLEIRCGRIWRLLH